MKKINFYCDIIGTYAKSFDDIDKPDKARKLNLKLFVDALDNLAISENAQSIIFSFVSTCSKEDICKCVKEIAPYIKKSKYVQFGKMFALDEYTNKNKPLSIIKDFENKKDVCKVFYADDTVLYHDLINYIYKYKKLTNGFVNFITNNNSKYKYSNCEKNINGLIQIINSFIENTEQNCLDNY